MGLIGTNCAFCGATFAFDPSGGAVACPQCKKVFVVRTGAQPAAQAVSTPPSQAPATASPNTTAGEAEALPPEQAAAILKMLSSGRVPESANTQPAPATAPQTRHPVRANAGAAPQSTPKPARAVRVRTEAAQAQPAQQQKPSNVLPLLLGLAGVLMLAAAGGLLAAGRTEPPVDPDIANLNRKIELARKEYEVALAREAQTGLRLSEVEDENKDLKFQEELLARRAAALPATMASRTADADREREKIARARQEIQEQFQQEMEARDPAKVVEKSEKSVLVIRTDLGSGTGFVFAPGYAATNYHVIMGASELKVSMQKRDSRETIELQGARIVAVRPEHDLAIISLPAVPAEVAVDGRYPATPIRKMGDIRSGESVFVIGNPGLGNVTLDYTVTKGIVSNPSREYETMRVLQTSAPVNPGNSGGPLFDQYGNVLGVVTAKGIGVEAVTFAVPVSYLLTLYEGRARAPHQVANSLEEWEKKNNPMAILARQKRKMLDKTSVALEDRVKKLLPSRDGTKLYLMFSKAGKIAEFDLATKQVGRVCHVGGTLTAMALQDDQTLLVCAEDTPVLTLVNLSTMSLAEQVQLKKAPAGLAAVGGSTKGMLLTDPDELPLYLDENTMRRRPPIPREWPFEGLMGAGTSGNWFVALTCSDAGVYSIKAYPVATAISSFNQWSVGKSNLDQASDAQRVGQARNTLQRLADAYRKVEKYITLPNDAYSEMKVVCPYMFFLPGDRVVCARRVLKLGTDIVLEGAFAECALAYSKRADAEFDRVVLFMLDNIFSVSPDGKYAASGVAIYDVNTRQIIRKLPLSSMCHAFSKDGRTLYLASMNSPELFILEIWAEMLAEEEDP